MTKPSWVLAATIMILFSCGAGLRPQTEKTDHRSLPIDHPPQVSGNDSVAAPPAYLELDPFYTKYLDAAGIPVIGSEEVPDEAFYAARTVIEQMLKKRRDVADSMIRHRIRVGIIAKGQKTTDLPEYRELNTLFPGSDWDNTRGIGATRFIPLSSCAEENLLCYGEGEDPYADEDILIHEFAHSMLELGIIAADPSALQKIKDIYERALQKGLWAHTYAATNFQEYFAEGVQSWYNLNAEAIPGNGIHNQVNTRRELKEYDPELYGFLRLYFSSDTATGSCHPPYRD